MSRTRCGHLSRDLRHPAEVVLGLSTAGQLLDETLKLTSGIGPLRVGPLEQRIEPLVLGVVGDALEKLHHRVDGFVEATPTQSDVREQEQAAELPHQPREKPLRRRSPDACGTVTKPRAVRRGQKPHVGVSSREELIIEVADQLDEAWTRHVGLEQRRAHPDLLGCRGSESPKPAVTALFQVVEDRRGVVEGELPGIEVRIDFHADEIADGCVGEPAKQPRAFRPGEGRHVPRRRARYHAHLRRAAPLRQAQVFERDPSRAGVFDGVVVSAEPRHHGSGIHAPADLQRVDDARDVPDHLVGPPVLRPPRLIGTRDPRQGRQVALHAPVDEAPRGDPVVGEPIAHIGGRHPGGSGHDVQLTFLPPYPPTGMPGQSGSQTDRPTATGRRAMAPQSCRRPRRDGPPARPKNRTAPESEPTQCSQRSSQLVSGRSTTKETMCLRTNASSYIRRDRQLSPIPCTLPTRRSTATPRGYRLSALTACRSPTRREPWRQQ